MVIMQAKVCDYLQEDSLTENSLSELVFTQFTNELIFNR